jgi:hypothetical protein
LIGSSNWRGAAGAQAAEFIAQGFDGAVHPTLQIVNIRVCHSRESFSLNLHRK